MLRKWLIISNSYGCFFSYFIPSNLLKLPNAHFSFFSESPVFINIRFYVIIPGKAGSNLSRKFFGYFPGNDQLIEIRKSMNTISEIAFLTGINNHICKPGNTYRYSFTGVCCSNGIFGIQVDLHSFLRYTCPNKQFVDRHIANPNLILKEQKSPKVLWAIIYSSKPVLNIKFNVPFMGTITVWLSMSHTLPKVFLTGFAFFTAGSILNPVRHMPYWQGKN